MSRFTFLWDKLFGKTFGLHLTVRMMAIHCRLLWRFHWRCLVLWKAQVLARHHSSRVQTHFLPWREYRFGWRFSRFTKDLQTYMQSYRARPPANIDRRTGCHRIFTLRTSVFVFELFSANLPSMLGCAPGVVVAPSTCSPWEMRGFKVWICLNSSKNNSTSGENSKPQVPRSFEKSPEFPEPDVFSACEGAACQVAFRHWGHWLKAPEWSRWNVSLFCYQFLMDLFCLKFDSASSISWCGCCVSWPKSNFNAKLFVGKTSM